MTVHFYLRPRTKGDEASIQAVIRWDYKKLTKNVGESVLVKDWNEKQQKVRRSDPDAFYKNERLEAYKEAIAELYKPFGQLGIEPTLDEFRELLNPKKQEQAPGSKLAPKSFFAFVDHFMEGHKLRLSAAGKPLSQNSVVNSYQQTKKLLEEYQPNIGFEDFDMAWYASFVAYCKGRDRLGRDTGKRFTPNNIGKHIKNIKAILRAAYEEGISKNEIFKDKKFKVIKEKVHSVFLSLDELKKLEGLNLSHLPRYEKARDLFLFGCWTGLRISDFKRVKKKHIIDSKFIVIKAQKTDSEVEIPLFSPTKKILEKYDFELPYMPDQSLNSLIKEIGKLAGIVETVEATKNRGFEVEEIKRPKFHFISSHTARRSFATNLYKMGVPAISIMAITGHSSEKVFLNYIKMTTREHSEMILATFEEKYKELSAQV